MTTNQFVEDPINYCLKLKVVGYFVNYTKSRLFGNLN